jgi:2-methylisocitrate lyase-like PEP mutase family enzyme
MTDPRPSVAERRRRFRALHVQGCFVIPNPWDAGSARWLAGLGFQALASTSSGFAWSQGRADNTLARDAVLAHLAALVDATALPVSADFENGFGADADAVGESVSLALATGIAGLSIEDSSGDAQAPLFPLADAVARIAAARRAIDAAGGEVLLVGRTEGYLWGRPDPGEAIERLQAYAAAGADCLYAPGLRSEDDIGAVVAAVAPKPVNLLVGWGSDMTVARAAALGVRRISVGGALARSAWAGFMTTAREIAEQGSFGAFTQAVSGQALNTFFGDVHTG